MSILKCEETVVAIIYSIAEVILVLTWFGAKVKLKRN